MGRAGGFRGRAVVMVVALVLAGALAGCSGTSLLPGHHKSATACAPDADGPPAGAAQVAVVCGWASALQAGDLARAAGYFHLPSVFDNETGVITLHTRTQAEVVNSALSCGATPISAFRQGRYVNVLFRLTSRRGRGSACGAGIGQTARTRFLISGGKILAWLRAPAAGSGGGSSAGSGSTV